ncbi:MAG TPA: TIGR00366 family protein [Stellaceae bacterium]|jgi:short-chain fatty acids transporter|nr:TIGR00366 family protein [Stellaceae bacterium]
MTTHTASGPGPATKRNIVSFFVALFERFMPDPFALAILLTLVVGILAVAFAPHADARTLLNSWFSGMFNILAFGFQMILILATGHALATAPAVRRLLRALVSAVASPAQAAVLVFVVVGIAAYLNWGLGLVVGAFLAREIARRFPVDFGWLVAAAYSAWSICNSGLSSSIALSQASHGSSLNIVEKETGHIMPLSDSIFTLYTLLPTLLVLVVMCVLFILMRPPASQAVPLAQEEAPVASERVRTGTSVAHWLESSPLGTILIVIAGAAYLALDWQKSGFSLELNTLILLFLLVGMALQGTPIAYATAIREAARQTGSILLQFPFYGGIMGIMIGTGLAGEISKFFTTIANADTLPVWSYVSSLIITLLVPSAGGHWAVQGPFVVPATLALHASLPASTMAVAMAENVSNMIQPFWAVPIVAIAGIGIQRVMGFTVVTFLVSLVIYGSTIILLGRV